VLDKAEGFSFSLDVVYERRRIVNCNFWSKKDIKHFSAVFFADWVRLSEASDIGSSPIRAQAKDLLQNNETENRWLGLVMLVLYLSQWRYSSLCIHPCLLSSNHAYQYWGSGLASLRIRIQEAKPMRIQADPGPVPDPGKTFKSQKVEFLHEKYSYC
jgi:hypothetical protein